MKEKAKRLTELEILMDAFDFTEDDLRANAKGQLTSHQKQRIQNLGFSAMEQLYLLAMLFVGSIGVLILSIVGTILSVANTSAPVILGITLGVLLIVGVIMHPLYRRQNLLSEMAAGKLSRIEGLAIVNTDPYQPRFEVNSIQLKANLKALHSLKNMESYRFYYLPKSKVVVSVVPSRKSK